MPLNEHDLRYKRLFSNHRLVEELLRSFVPLEFVQDLDFSTLKDARKSFVSERYQERESDIIYQIQFKGRVAYIYLLIEFQSTVDHFMPLRMLRYILEFYDDLIVHEKPRSKILPAVFPILLYNGDRHWDAPVNIRELIDSGTIECAYIPDFSYFKIAENEFGVETLRKIKNGIAGVFLIENTDPHDRKKQIDALIEIIEDEQPEVINLLQGWFLNFLKRADEKEELTQKFLPLTEVKTMFATKLDAWGKELFAEGIEQGIEQKAREDAKKLKEAGVDIKTIASCTGLSEEEVRQL